MHSHLKALQISKLNPKDLVIFFHVPKTGGSSMADLLSGAYGDKYARMTSKELNVLLRDHPLVTDVKAVLGHYSLADTFYKHINQPINHLVLFREPIDRVISHYYFLKKEQSHPQHYVAMKYSLEEVFKENIAVQLGMSNYQTYVMSSVPFSTPPIQQLSLAKENVSRLFSFVGLYEKYNEFVQICAHFLDWPKASIPWVNGSVRPKTKEIDQNIIRLIMDHNESDLALYEHVRELYAARLKESYSDVLGSEEQRIKFREINITRPKELTRWERIKYWYKRKFQGD